MNLVNMYVAMYGACDMLSPLLRQCTKLLSGCYRSVS